MLKTENHFIQINATDRLHLMRFYENENGTPVFLLHGAIENGHIFYSKNQKGLAPFLAENGFDVYIGDLRGRGKSTPAISRVSLYGQTEAINEDIPAFIEHIIKLRGNVPQFWFAHSWGGVLLSSYFARYVQYRPLVKGMVYFATKRSIRVRNLHRYLMIDFMWNRFGFLLTKLYGYLPGKSWGYGSDNETLKSHAQSVTWVKPSAWVDPEDHFDYGAAIKKIKLPPILYLAGEKDYCLGNKNDVLDFIEESGDKSAKFILLSKKNGHLHDYDHINILTHPDAREDQFRLVLEWMQNLNK